MDERPKTRESPKPRGRRVSEPHEPTCGCIEMHTELHAGVSHFAVHELLFDEPRSSAPLFSSPFSPSTRPSYSTAAASKLSHSFSVRCSYFEAVLSCAVFLYS